MASPRADTMERFTATFANAHMYPQNMGDIESRSRALLEQLDHRARHLFCQDSKAAVQFMDLRKFDYARSDRGYAKHTIHSASSLENHLRLATYPGQEEPQQRFMLILGARDGRSALYITRAMFLQLLTYLQVKPVFLNFVFPFGRQLYTRDFHVSGYRSESCRGKASQSMKLPRLGRSGRHIDICYNLKSAERQHAAGSPTTGLQAWSIRQCSLQHKFDLETHKMSWVIINANGVVRNAVEAQLLRADGTDGLDGKPPSQWETALNVHTTITSWAGENWQWYLNELQDVLEEKTRRIRSIPHTSVTAEPSYSPPTSPHALKSPVRSSRGGWSMRSFSNAALGSLRRASTVTSRRTSPPTVLTDNAGSFTAEPETIIQGSLMDAAAADDLQFSDLQTIQWLEDEANNTLLILKANASVMHDLSLEYESVRDGNSGTQKLNVQELDRFAHHLRSMSSDFVMQQSRLEFMLRVLADRKSLLHGILQCRNMEFNKLLAEEAQVRAENMEYMTQKMHDIAQKTQLETVSMKTITLVTLFFLPGTFISTLMSTPIVAFNGEETSSFSLKSNVGFGALKLYLAFSLPCVALTFLVWAAMYRWEQRKETRSKQRDYPGDEESGTMLRPSDELKAGRVDDAQSMVSSGRKKI